MFAEVTNENTKTFQKKNNWQKLEKLMGHICTLIYLLTGSNSLKNVFLSQMKYEKELPTIVIKF